jgi:hypothetical protein
MPATTSSGRVRAETSTPAGVGHGLDLQRGPGLDQDVLELRETVGVSHTTTFVGIVFEVSADAGWGLRRGRGARAEGLGP